VQTLSKLEQPTDNWGTILIHIILPKIDKGSRREWELKRSSFSDEFPTLKEFTDFLANRSFFLETLSRVNRRSQSSNDFRNSSKATQASGKNTSQSYIASSKSSCSIYSGEHEIFNCNAFTNISVKDKHAEIKRRHLSKCYANLEVFTKL